MADMNKHVAPGNGRDNAKIVQTAAELEQLLDELGEIESFEPPPEFRARARITDPEVYEAAARDPEGYWAERARELHWDTPFSTVLDESKAAVRHVVRRRHAQRLLQLPGSARRGRAR